MQFDGRVCFSYPQEDETPFISIDWCGVLPKEMHARNRGVVAARRESRATGTSADRVASARGVIIYCLQGNMEVI